MNGLNINDDDEDVDNNENEPPTHLALMTELQAANLNEVLAIINVIELNLGLRFGRYGSINPGTAGVNYITVRNILMAQELLPDHQVLRRYLTEPVHHLPEYQHVGRGLQSRSRVMLNTCWSKVLFNIQRVLGMLFVIHRPE